MSKQENERCGNCKFFSGISGGIRGQQMGKCRFNPPTDGFPRVQETDWCGQWKWDRQAEEVDLTEEERKQ